MFCLGIIVHLSDPPKKKKYKFSWLKIIDPSHTLKKNGVETIFTEKLLVNFTINYKETASKTFD